jgi:hypothetical protein
MKKPLLLISLIIVIIITVALQRFVLAIRGQDISSVNEMISRNQPATSSSSAVTMFDIAIEECFRYTHFAL